MLIKDLIKHLSNLDQELEVKLMIDTKLDDSDDSSCPTLSKVDSIEFSDTLVMLKGKDELAEWD